MKLRTALLGSLLVAALAVIVPAQNHRYAPSDTPGTGTCNSIPWGQSSARHQHLVTAAELGNAPQVITDIAYSACSTGTLTAGQILIRMSHTSSATLGSDFTINLGANPVTVLNATNWSYAYTSGAWADVGLTAPFAYDPAFGNLVIDIEFCGAAGGASFHRDVSPRAYLNGGSCPSANLGSTGSAALKVRLETSGGSYTSIGTACGSPAAALAGTGAPNIGGSLSIAMSNGVPNTLGFYLLGFAPANLPLDSIGAPGCTLHTQPFTALATGFDGLGASVPLVLPIANNPALVGASVVFDGLMVDPAANALGMTTSNGLVVVVGV
ncbi:MAG: hypothetical protein U1F36_16050 [Planctomycetota bacterium]